MPLFMYIYVVPNNTARLLKKYINLFVVLIEPNGEERGES